MQTPSHAGVKNPCTIWFRNPPLLLSVLILSLAFSACSDDPPTQQKEADPRAMGPFPITHDPVRLDLIGENTCVACHAEAVHSWAGSDHAHANRPVRESLDRPAFTPPRKLKDGETDQRLQWSGDSPELTVNRNGQEETYAFDGVLAYDPLRQYLAPFPGGKWQATTAAYDPSRDEWFEVYEGEGRLPGEWGHWTGQGMNWNANCAYCHMTEFEKNIDPPTGNYHSTWTRQSISCVQCHSGLEDHVETADQTNGGRLPQSLSPVQIEASCASCHSRRDQLTAEKFRPGDTFHDHFELSLPDQPSLYYADGQIRDEVFVYGSFRMSRMGHAGISCMDCHDPHSMELTRPLTNNATCTNCHDDGLQGAPIIDPVAHSHHSEGSAGNSCVECHMPKTTYMQRDPRGDHAFLSPDPMMTRELGIPNACNKCHEEETVQWAEKAVADWYPEAKVLNRQRQRARALTSAWERDPAAASKLLKLADDEDIPAWRATYTGLLQPYTDNTAVLQYLTGAIDDPNPLVRSRAAYALGQAGATGPRFNSLLDDPSRNVRLSAARSFASLNQKVPNVSTANEWESYLLFNSDRPQNTFILADAALREGDAPAVKQWITRTIAIEPTNPEIYRQSAILYSRLGDVSEANRLLEKAYSLAPNQALYPYSLALLRAEEGKLPETIQLLKIATRLDPNFDRAWYNLALALLQNGAASEARMALNRAVSLMSTQEWQQASESINQALRNWQ